MAEQTRMPRAWAKRAEVTENQESEFSCLGGVMLDNRAFDALSGLLRAEDFADQRHGLIWTAMAQLVARSQPIEPATVARVLDESGDLAKIAGVDAAGQPTGGIEYLLGLAEAVASAVNIEHHGRIVADFAAKRRFILKLEDGAQSTRETSIDEMPPHKDAIIADLLDDHREAPTAAVDIVRAAGEAWQEMKARKDNPQPVIGIPSGLTDLDALTCGWEDGDLITLGAPSGHGKTMIGVQFGAEGARLSRRHTIYFSVEVPASRIARRLLANYGQVDAGRLKTASLTAEEWAKLGHGIDTKFNGLRDLMSVAFAPKATVATVHREVRRYLLRKPQYPLGLVVVDYVQRLHAVDKRRSREEEVADIARSLKDLANEYKVPVLALAQLNRDINKRAEKRPQASDLRESSALEHESSLLLFLHRPEMWGKPEEVDPKDKGIAEIVVTKARDGEQGVIRVGLNAAQQRLYDFSERPYGH